MRGIATLVELARRDADERRAALARIGDAKANADAARAMHEKQQLSEANMATNDPAILATVDAWSHHTRRVGQALSARCAELGRQEEVARDALRLAFVGMKRLQIARDNGFERERLAALRRADIRASEAFALVHLRGIA